MKKILLPAAVAVMSIFALNAHAEMKPYKNTPEYKAIDKEARTSLQNCLKDEKNMTKDCMKQTKEMMKAKKKTVKKNYKMQQKKMHNDTKK